MTRPNNDAVEPGGDGVVAANPNLTFRLFLLGAGFSKPAGLPLAVELLEDVRKAAGKYVSDSEGWNHLEGDIERYEEYLADTDPSRPFDLEEFGAWLDWEHILRLKGSDTWSDEGNRSSLQLRWAIGHVLHEAMPTTIPEVYLEFARRLTATDTVLTLNYDLLLERALEEVGLPYRRFPDRYSEVYDTYSVVDSEKPRELLLSKLHGSMDWVHVPVSAKSPLHVEQLVEGPRPSDDPLKTIGVIRSDELSDYYQNSASWWRSPPIIMAPSTAKPLARSSLVPLWDGLLPFAHMRGTFVAIGCSLPNGDPYVRQVVHHVAKEIGSSLETKSALAWPQTPMKVVDYRTDRVGRADLLERYRFMPPSATDFVLDGFSLETLDQILPSRTT